MESPEVRLRNKRNQLKNIRKSLEPWMLQQERLPAAMQYGPLHLAWLAIEMGTKTQTR